MKNLHSFEVVLPVCASRCNQKQEISFSASAFAIAQKDLLVMYGGEWFDGADDKTYVYGDLFLYDAGKDRWKKVTAPNG